jgi:AcrR family transcriptional regulator
MLSNALVRRAKRTRNLAETRKEILNAAFNEILAHGFHATSIDAILEKIALTKGALFHQFASKLELGYAVVDEVIGPMTMARWVDPLAAFENPLEGILHQLKRNIGDAPPADLNLGCPMNNLIQEMANSDPEFQRRLKRVMARWIDGVEVHIKRGQKAGYIIRGVKARDIAQYVVMSHEGFFGIIKGMRDKSIFRSLLKSLALYFVGISARDDFRGSFKVRPRPLKPIR